MSLPSLSARPRPYPGLTTANSLGPCDRSTPATYPRRTPGPWSAPCLCGFISSRGALAPSRGGRARPAEHARRKRCRWLAPRGIPPPSQPTAYCAHATQPTVPSTKRFLPSLGGQRLQMWPARVPTATTRQPHGGRPPPGGEPASRRSIWTLGGQGREPRTICTARAGPVRRVTVENKADTSPRDNSSKV